MSGETDAPEPTPPETEAPEPTPPETEAPEPTPGLLDNVPRHTSPPADPESLRRRGICTEPGCDADFSAEAIPAARLGQHRKSAHGIIGASKDKVAGRIKSAPGGGAGSRQHAPKQAAPPPDKVSKVEQSDKDRRTQEWERYLLTDANRLLVKLTSGWIGIPPEWMTAKPPPELRKAVAEGPKGLVGLVPVAGPAGTITHLPIWNPPLPEQLALSRRQAHTLARAGAEFSDSPMGMAIQAWISANSQWLTLLAALGVAASYGWGIMRTRGQVQALLGQMAATPGMGAPPAPASSPGEAPTPEEAAQAAAYAAAMADIEAESRARAAASAPA